MTHPLSTSHVFISYSRRDTEAMLRIVAFLGGQNVKVLLKKMQEPNVHDALKRNVVGILQCCEIPKSQLGIVATLCFEYLSSPNTPVPIQANAMTVLQRISEREPDLKRELRTSIELMLPYGTGAIWSRARKVMKQLERESPPSSRKRVRDNRGKS